MKKLILSFILVSGVSIFADEVSFQEQLQEKRIQEIFQSDDNEEVIEVKEVKPKFVKKYMVTYFYQGEKHFAKFTSKQSMYDYIKNFNIRKNPNITYRIVIIKESYDRKITYVDESKPVVIEVK